MSLVEQAAHLGRLGLVLSQRGAATEPVLNAIVAGHPDRVLVGTSALGRRVEIVIPFHPGALAALGPAVGGGTQQLRIRCDGAELSYAQAGDEAAAILPAWQAIVDQFCAIGGKVTSRAVWSTGASSLWIDFARRDATEDRTLMYGFDQLGEDLGVSPAQRRLWLRVHPQLGHGAEISVATAATATTVSTYMGVTYRSASWPLAVQLAQGLVLNDSEAQEVPTRLGELAGAVGIDPVGIELVLGPHEPPDVVVWVPIASTP